MEAYPLHDACRRGAVQEVVALLGGGLDINQGIVFLALTPRCYFTAPSGY